MIKGKCELSRVLSLGMTVFVLLACAVYLGEHVDEVQRILAFRPTFLTIAVATILARVGVIAWMNRAILWTLDVRINSREAVALAAITMAGNLLLPMQAGAAYRAYYLKETHSLAYPKFAAALIGGQLLILATTSALAAGLLLAICPLGQSIVSDVSIAASIALLGASVCLLGFSYLRLPDWRWLRPLHSTSQAGRVLLKSPMLIVKIIVASVCMRCCDVACFWFLSSGAGIEIGVLAAAALTNTAAISSCINITPGSVGVYEGIICLLGKPFGVSAVAGLTISLTCRVLAATVSMGLALPALAALSRGKFSAVSESGSRDEALGACVAQFRGSEE